MGCVLVPGRGLLTTVPQEQQVSPIPLAVELPPGQRRPYLRMHGDASTNMCALVAHLCMHPCTSAHALGARSPFAHVGSSVRHGCAWPTCACALTLVGTIIHAPICACMCRLRVRTFPCCLSFQAAKLQRLGNSVLDMACSPIYSSVTSEFVSCI